MVMVRRMINVYLEFTGVWGLDRVIDTNKLLIQSGLTDIACPQLTQL